MKSHIAALEVFNARYIYSKLPSQGHTKGIKFEDYDLSPKYCSKDMNFSELADWLNQEGWSIIYDEERYNKVVINLNSDIVFTIPRTTDDMVSIDICQLIFIYVAIDKINKKEPNHVNRVWAKRFSEKMLDRTRNNFEGSSAMGFSRWTCSVCDGVQFKLSLSGLSFGDE